MCGQQSEIFPLQVRAPLPFSLSLSFNPLIRAPSEGSLKPLAAPSTLRDANLHERIAAEQFERRCALLAANFAKQ
jgi:hypothetical protein